MEPEVIDISSFGDSNNSSSNFGGGIELLMNEKKGSKSSEENIDVSDIERLESELNEMSDTAPDSGSNTLFSDPLPESINLDNDDKPSVRFGDTVGDSSDTGKTSTWDGYNRFNEIPITPEKTMQSQPTQSKEELLREKFQLLRKLESLEQKGVQLSKKYTMDSPLLEMKGEYETIIDEKAKQNSIKFQGNMLMTCINGIEFLNNKFDPFDVKLDGWSEQVAENVDDYDEVFGELYDKYKSKGTMAPELRLLFQLGGSAMMLHMTNSMFKSAMPGMDDVLRQNPDLAQQFQKAAMDSMGTTSPGFSGFMNNMTGPPPTTTHAPPPPQATQGPNAVPLPNSRHGNNSSFSTRPDLNNMSRMGQPDGMNISENFSSATAPERSSIRPPQNNTTGRAEMRGPSDIDDLLSGLKTKKVSMTGQERSPLPPPGSTIESVGIPVLNDSSTISISDLKNLQSTSDSEPKRSRKRKTSEKNTVSLDI